MQQKNQNQSEIQLSPEFIFSLSYATKYENTFSLGMCGEYTLE